MNMVVENNYHQRWKEDGQLFDPSVEWGWLRGRLPEGSSLHILDQEWRRSVEQSNLALVACVKASRLTYILEYVRPNHNASICLALKDKDSRDGVWVWTKKVWCAPLKKYLWFWRVGKNPSWLMADDIKSLGRVLAWDRIYPIEAGRHFAVEQHMVRELCLNRSKRPKKLQHGEAAIARCRTQLQKVLNPNSTTSLTAGDYDDVSTEVQNVSNARIRVANLVIRVNRVLLHGQAREARLDAHRVATQHYDYSHLSLVAHDCSHRHYCHDLPP